MRRRAFVATVGGAAAAAVLPGCAALVATPVTPVNGVIRVVVRNFAQLEQPGGWLRLRSADTGDLIVVVALDDGSYAALSPVCTHLQCTVNVEGALLVCPCHGSTFDRVGRVLRGPAERALRRYPAALDASGELAITVAGSAV
jgi:Rieske Fe-S protein